jgi:hypothetical protein
MKMVFEKETVFINQFGISFRRCDKKECIWNADCNELSAGGYMTGKIRPEPFEGRVCNCSTENSVSIQEASKVNCYPVSEL